MQNPLIAAPSELKGEVFQFLDKLSVYQNVDAGEHPVCKRRVDLTSGNHIFVKKISTVTPDGFCLLYTSGMDYYYLVRAYKTVGNSKYYIDEGVYANLNFILPFA